MSSASSAMGSHQGSSSGTLRVGVEDYFEEEFDLRHSKKKEVLKELLAQLSGLNPKNAAIPSCFISYAWPEETHLNYEKQKYHQHWVGQLAELLETTGVTVFFDKWEDGVGKRVNKFLEELANPFVFVLVVGTKLYVEKCDRVSPHISSSEHVVAFESVIIKEKLGRNELSRERVFPILLEGKKEESLPKMLRAMGQIPCDFTEGDYFRSVLRLAQNLYRIDNRDVKFQALLKDLEIRTKSIDERISNSMQREYRERKIKEKLELQRQRVRKDEIGSTSPQHSPRHYVLSEKSREEDMAALSLQNSSPSLSLSATSHATASSELSCLGPWRESVLKNEEVTRELELYVPIRAGLSPHDKNSSDLMTQVRTFLEDQEAQVLLLLGSSGSGKSSFGQHLEQELWHNPELAKGRIPLWINLPGLSHPQHKAIEEALEQKRVPFAEVGRLKQEKTFLFILDGYDEIRAGGNLYVSNRLGEWKAKVLVTCRQEYFMADPTGYRYQFMPAKGQRPVSSGLWERYVSPFSKDDVNHYLQEYIKIKKSEWSLSRYLEQIERLPELKELIETPFLLRITAEVLPMVVQQHEQDKEALKLTRLGLYEAFVTQWFERHLAKYMQDSSIELLGVNPMEALRGFSERLALKMREAGVDAVQHEEGKPSQWSEFFKDDPKNKLMRRACPLKKIGAYRYTFIHRSLLEYFVTPLLLQDVNRMGGAGKDELSAATSVAFSTLDTLNGKLLNSEPSVIYFLVDAVRNDAFLKEKLFAVLELSKRDAMVAIAAANAATILNTAGVSFVGRDLKGARLAGADLSHGIYDSTNFEGADLRGVQLQGAWLHRANFRNALMQGVQFGEYAALSFDEEIKGCCYSPDGRWLAVAHRNVIELLDVATWKKRWTLQGHEGVVTSMAFSPDGGRVVSGSNDDTLRLWDVESGKALLKPFEGHTRLVTSVAFSPDGRKVVSGSYDRTLRLWDVERGEPLSKPLEGHTGWVTSVAFSPDGKRIASAGEDETLRLWDVESGKALLKPLEGHMGRVTSIAFSPDGKKMASGSTDKTVRLWDVEQGRALLKPLEGHTGSVNSVAFSPDGRKVVSGSYDKTLRLWDIEQIGRDSIVLDGHTSLVESVAFSPDGRRIVSGSFDGMLRVWDVERGTLLRLPRGHAGAVTGVAFCLNGKQIVSASDDRSLRVWDAESGEALLKPFVGHTFRATSVACSSDGRRVVSGSDDKTLRLWDVESGKTLLKPLEGHTGHVTSVAFSPDGRKVVSGSADGTLRLWGVESGEVLLKPLMGHSSRVNSVTFSPDGRWVVSGSADGTLRVWDVERGEPFLKLFEAGMDGVNGVAFSPNGRQVASVGWDSVIQLWEVDGDSWQKQKTLDGRARWVTSIAFSLDGRYVASTGPNGVLVVHDIQTDGTYCLVHTFRGINSVAWHAHDPVHSNDETAFLVTGHVDSSVRYWRWRNHQLTLLWSSHCQGALVSGGANIKETQLSEEQAQLLIQRGAVGASGLGDALGTEGWAGASKELTVHPSWRDFLPQFCAWDEGPAPEVAEHSLGSALASAAVDSPFSNQPGNSVLWSTTIVSIVPSAQSAGSSLQGGSELGASQSGACRVM